MPRGRPKRTITCKPPPRGYYLADWRVNVLMAAGLLAGRPLELWMHIRALSWENGRCDATDVALAGLMGGVKPEGVRVARRKLVELGLLYEYREGRERCLVPLPLPADMAGRLPAAARAALARLAGDLAGRVQAAHVKLARQQWYAEAGFLPPANWGLNSSGVRREEEELIDSDGVMDLNPPPLPGKDARAIARATEEGAGGGSNPPPDRDPNGEGPDGGEYPSEPEELARWLTCMGVFEGIARTLAPRYLARMSLDEAVEWTYAWHRAIRGGTNMSGGAIDEERARGRLVYRLREMARPPRAALEEARLYLTRAPLGDDGLPVEDPYGTYLYGPAPGGASEAEGEDGDEGEVE